MRKKEGKREENRIERIKEREEKQRGPKFAVKENQDDTAFPVASVENLFADTSSQDKGTSQRNLPQSASKARQDGPEATHFEELINPAKQDDPEATLFEELSNPAKYGLCQPRNTESGSVIINGRNLSGTGYAEQIIKEKQSIPVVSVNDKQDMGISAIPVEEQEISISTTNVIVLSDDDEQEANAADNSMGRKVVESPENSIWYCVGPYVIRAFLENNDAITKTTVENPSNI
ncbi:hypothetical protein JHK82_031933 [Glycine max]|nr:hypothetical protein JHK82_031933 [Glycine max]